MEQPYSGMKWLEKRLDFSELEDCDCGIFDMKYRAVKAIMFIVGEYIGRCGLGYESAYRLCSNYMAQIDKAECSDDICLCYYDAVRALAASTEASAEHKVCSLIVTKCTEYINSHINEHISVSDIANRLGVSQQYLSRVFHRDMGLTVCRYITVKKVEAAQYLIANNNCSTAEIGDYLSFNSYSYFIQKFREETGMTPKEYKQKLIGIQPYTGG